MFSNGSPFAALVRRKPPRTVNDVPLRTAAERNVRVPVGVAPQEAPSPIRQGDTPARIAQWPIVTFRYDDTYQQQDHMVMPGQEFQYASRTMKGRQAPFGPRSNIEVPPHVAYGSLFTSNQPTYGMG